MSNCFDSQLFVLLDVISVFKSHSSVITSPLRVCMLGNRSISWHELHDNLCAKTTLSDYNVSESFNSTEAPPITPLTVEKTTDLWSRFCDSSELNAQCDKYFTHNNVTKIEGIPGLASGLIAGITHSHVACYTVYGNIYTTALLNSLI